MKQESVWLLFVGFLVWDFFFFIIIFSLWGSGGSLFLGTKETRVCWTGTCLRPWTFRFSAARVWDAFYFSWAGGRSLAPQGIFPDQWLTKEIWRPVILIRLRKRQITFHLYLISFLYQNVNMKIRALNSEPFHACTKEAFCITESSCVWGLGLGIIWEYLNPGQIFLLLSVYRDLIFWFGWGERLKFFPKHSNV